MLMASPGFERLGHFSEDRIADERRMTAGPSNFTVSQHPNVNWIMKRRHHLPRSPNQRFPPRLFPVRIAAVALVR